MLGSVKAHTTAILLKVISQESFERKVTWKGNQSVSSQDHKCSQIGASPTQGCSTHFSVFTILQIGMEMLGQNKHFESITLGSIMF